MPRVPYAREIAGPPELVAAIRRRRGGTLLNLDRMLLNSPGFAAGWNTHLGAVRGGLALDARLRELVICGVAVLNGADYEFAQHLPEFIRAGGSEAAAIALQDYPTAYGDRVLFSDVERAAMRLTLEMTRQVAVSDDCFAELQRQLPDPQHQVELVGVISTYNMVSRFLVALRVEPEGPAGEPR